MLKISKIILILTIALLSGCATQKNISVTPESIKNKGLLIGHISTSDWGSRLSHANWELIINGEKYKDVFKNGYIALTLPAGKYELESLFNYSVASMGAVSSSSSSSRPIKAKFTIKKGEITNLGEVFLFSRKRKSKRYNVIYLDNNKDMHAYMKAMHKNIFHKFKKKSFNKADVKYVKKKDVNKIRRMALSQSRQFNRYVTTGSLGGIAITKRTNNGKINSVSIVKTNTFNRPYSCTFGKTKTACIVPSLIGREKIFLADKTNYKLLKKPEKFTGGKFIMLKDNSILWMNADYAFYKTKDMGKTWVANTKHKRKNVKTSFWEELGGGSRVPEVSQARKGFYVHSLSGSDTMLYVDYKTGATKNIGVPVKGDGVAEIIETAKGLYVKTNSTSYFSDSEIYFKPHSKSKWLKRIVPKSICKNINTKNYNAGVVTVTCRDQEIYKTANLGKTWKRIK